MKITDGQVSLSVDRIPPWTDEYVREIRVTMSGPDLAASTADEASNGDDLAGFLEGLYADWRGWDGFRSWRTLGGKTRIEATHRSRGHIDLAVTLRSDHLDGWTVTYGFDVVTEDLRRLAGEARHLFAW